MLDVGSTFSRKEAVEKLRASLPKHIDNHELLRVIGSGAYGDVMLARNTVTGTYRAIKFIWRQAFREERPYQRELAAIRFFEPISRSHEGFVQILQVGEFQSGFYYVMELADDEGMGQTIQPASYVTHSLARKTMQASPPQECISIGIHLANALAVLHRAGLIHRDIKPANIIFVNSRPKLADIGLVTQIADANSFVGTAGFVPPEGPISPASDIYSLGKVLYELATGKDRCEFPDLPETLLPDQALYLELNHIILKACDPRSERRYRSAEELRRDLELLEAGASIKRLRRLQQRFRKAAVAAAVLAVLGVAGFVLRERARIEAERRIAYVTTRGTELMNDGDYASAVPFFLAAVSEDRKRLDAHRLRIGGLVANGIRKVATWKGAKLAAFSPSGDLLAGVRETGLEVCDSRTGSIQRTIPITNVTILAISGTGCVWAATGSALISADWRGETVQRFVFPRTIKALAIHPDETEVAIAMEDRVQFLSVEARPVEEIPIAASDPVSVLVYSPDGRRILLGKQSGGDVWDRETRKKISPTFSHKIVYAALFDRKDENRILTSGFDIGVFWDIRNGDELTKRLDHEYGISALALSPDGNTLASGGFDQKVVLSHPRTLVARKQNPVLYHPERVSELAFVGNQFLVVHCYDGSNHVWDLNPAAPEAVEIAWWRPPSTKIASKEGLKVEGVGSTVIVRESGRSVKVLEMHNEVSTVAVHPHTGEFAVGARDESQTRFDVKVFDAHDLRRPKLRLPHRDGINFIRYSPTGKRMISCSEDHTAILWDAMKGIALTSPMKHEWQVTWADFSRDEKWVATASWDATVRIWDAHTGESLTPPLKFPYYLHWVAFEEDNKAISAANIDGRLRYHMELPFADLPLEQYRNVLPAPDSLIVNPIGF